MKPVKCNLELLERSYGAKNVPYNKLLLTEEWKSVRDEIIKRDSNACEKCGKGETTFLNGVHWWIYMVEIIESVDSENGWGPVTIVVDEMEMDLADKSYHLEVHHKYYMANKYPWQYPSNALVTLCNWCHQEIHDTNVIPVLNHKGEALEYTPCDRCNGSGSFPEYSHIQSGVCFKCNGARYEELIDK